ncbi:MAG: cytochrome P460 family protein [Burkholderiales bacterium]
MKRRIAVTAAIATTAIALTGCAGQQGQTEADGPPRLSGNAIWGQMQNADYSRNWAMWPGTQALYKGNEPHGMLLTTYVNQPALDAIRNKAGTMPDGALVIKENYMPDGKLAAITVMYKAKNYNPSDGDWYWVKYGPDGGIEAEGKEPMCIACHSAVKNNDYLYTGPVR